MITAVDTSVLLDVFLDDPAFADASEAALATALSQGAVVVCDAVLAETRAVFGNSDLFSGALEALGIEYAPSSRKAAELAGGTWQEYRARGGKRDRIVADFLIGAHAAEDAERLLTRDRGFYRSYFQSLTVWAPG